MIKAIIFDMDGVISDTQKLHALTEAKLLKEYGIEVTPEYISENYGGMIDKEFFKKIFEEHGVSEDINTVFRKKWERMALLENDIISIPGAIKIINDLDRMGLKLAVASSAPAKFIEIVLSKLNIKEKFKIITSGDEVKRGKPNPDIFLLTAKKLNISPQECLVIEDAYAGMLAAKNANMKRIGLVKDKNKQYPANLIITDLKELNIAKIINF